MIYLSIISHFSLFFTESLIARFSIQGELGVGSNWTQYSSRQATKEIDFEYRVTCESNYYGAGCETLCRERDDSFGHFACSASGQRMCFSGWQGDYCTKRKFLTRRLKSFSSSSSTSCSYCDNWGRLLKEKGLFEKRLSMSKCVLRGLNQDVFKVINGGLF